MISGLLRTTFSSPSLYNNCKKFPLRASFSKKVRSLKEKQMMQTKTPNMNVVSENTPESNKDMASLKDEEGSKFPTKLFKFAHYPAIILSGVEIYTGGVITPEIIQSFYIDMSTIHGMYYAYYYLMIFHRNPKIIDEKDGVKIFLGRLSMALAPWIPYYCFYTYPHLFSGMSSIITGVFPFAASQITDFVMLYKDKKLPHEDFFHKLKYAFLVFAISIALGGGHMYQSSKAQAKIDLLNQYQMKSDAHFGRDSSNPNNPNNSSKSEQKA